MGSAPEIPIGRVGRYDLLGRLAVGGMAEIFLARESIRGASRRAVVKFVRPDAGDEDAFRAMFEREAQIAIRLAHPSICHVYEFNAAAGRFYLAMELVEGQSLNDIIRRDRDRGRVVPPVVYAAIFARVADGLSYAHELRDVDGQPLGIVHRDVSPHNIMVSYAGGVKLLDFGIAKVKAASANASTGIETLKGRFSYMSPEQSRAEPVDARSDIFSLGICMHEALTHRRLYDRATLVATCEAIRKEPPPSVREVREDVDPELDAIVQRCLAKSPDDRWKNAGELQEALEGYLAYERQAVSSKRIARHMRELFEEEMSAGPKLDRRKDATGAFVILDEREAIDVLREPASSGSAPDGSSSAVGRARAIASDRRAWVIVAAVGVAVLAGVTGGDGEAAAPVGKRGAPLDEKAPAAVVRAEPPPDPAPVVSLPEADPAPDTEPAAAPPIAATPDRPGPNHSLGGMARTQPRDEALEDEPVAPVSGEVGPPFGEPTGAAPRDGTVGSPEGDPEAPSAGEAVADSTNETGDADEPSSEPGARPARRGSRVLRTPGF